MRKAGSRCVETDSGWRGLNPFRTNGTRQHKAPQLENEKARELGVMVSNEEDFMSAAALIVDEFKKLVGSGQVPKASTATKGKAVFESGDLGRKLIHFQGKTYTSVNSHEVYVCVTKAYWNEHFKDKPDHKVISRYQDGNEPGVTYWCPDFEVFGLEDEDLIVDLFGEDAPEFLMLESDQQETYTKEVMARDLYTYMRCLSIITDYNDEDGVTCSDEQYAQFLGLDPKQTDISYQG